MKLRADLFEIEGLRITSAELRAKYPHIPWDVLRARAERECVTWARMGAKVRKRHGGTANTFDKEAHMTATQRAEAAIAGAWAKWRKASPAPFGLVARLAT